MKRENILTILIATSGPFEEKTKEFDELLNNFPRYTFPQPNQVDVSSYKFNGY